MPISVIDISFCGNIELIASTDKEILSDPEFCPVCLPAIPQKTKSLLFTETIIFMNGILQETKSFILVLISGLLLMYISGCATFPKVPMLVDSYRADGHSPRITGPEGPLSEAEAKALLNRLKPDNERADILEHHIALMEAVTGKPLIAGNKVTLLCNGPQTFSAMKNAIRSATENINLETFIWRADRVGRSFADLLLQKQQEGVDVHAIYDGFGVFNTASGFFEQMREGGIRTLEFNPVGLFSILGEWDINNRDHRKILIVDGKIAFTGGTNIHYPSIEKTSAVISDKAEQQTEYYWRDTHIQIEGPAVAEFQRLFITMWNKHSRLPLSSGRYFPSLQERGNSLVRVLTNTPYQPVPHIYTAYISAIKNARKSIHLTHAYFIPDRNLLNALIQAAQAGVDVKIILPGVSDFRLPFYAGQSNYTALLEAGVKVYERSDVLLHSKTAVVDGVWATIGSSNMDHRSFLHDAEVNAVILDRDFGKQMEDMFAQDLALAKEVHLEQWRERPFTDRLKEWTARLFKYWL